MRQIEIYDGYQEVAAHTYGGHSTYRHAFVVAERVGAKELIPFHHDPSHDDETLDQMVEDAVRRFSPSFAVTAGREGAIIKVGPGRSPSAS